MHLSQEDDELGGMGKHLGKLIQKVLKGAQAKCDKNEQKNRTSRTKNNKETEEAPSSRGMDSQWVSLKLLSQLLLEKWKRFSETDQAKKGIVLVCLLCFV